MPANWHLPFGDGTTYCGASISRVTTVPVAARDEAMNRGMLCYECYYLWRVKRNIEKYID